MDIHQALDEFCSYATYIRGVSPDTIRRYQESILHFIRFSKVSDVREITKRLVLSFFFYGRTERNWKPRTYHTVYMSLHLFFKWVLGQGIIEENFCTDIELPRIERSLPKGLSKRDTEYLLELVFNFPWQSEFERHRNHAIFSTYIFTGIRRSELLNLKFTDVDLDNMQLRVNHGKGNKDRVIPICGTLARTLERYLRERKGMNRTCPAFFVSSQRDKGLTKDGLKHIIEKVKKASGIKFGNHVFRHTFAMLMLEGGCDIVSVSKMLGHSDIRVTMTYMQATVGHLHEQIRKHPLDIDPYRGAMQETHNRPYSCHATEGSQAHQVLRPYQL